MLELKGSQLQKAFLILTASLSFCFIGMCCLRKIISEEVDERVTRVIFPLPYFPRTWMTNS